MRAGAAAQEQGAGDRGDQRRGEDGDLDVVGPGGLAEGQFGDEQADGEAAAGEHADRDEVAPAQAGGQAREPGPDGQHATAEDTDGLADDQARDHRQGDPVGHEAAQRRGRQRHARGGEREQRYADPGRYRLQYVFEPLGGGLVVGRRLALAGVGAHAGGEADRDAGEGGVDAAGVQQRPGEDAERQVEPPAAEAELLAGGVGGDGGDRAEQRRDRDVGGEQGGDQDDGAEVVDDGQGEQEDAQGRRQVAGGDGKHG